MGKEKLTNIIYTNVNQYEVRESDCEALCYKAIASGIPRVILGPSSLHIADKFRNTGLKFGVTIAYPSGAVIPELKVEEIKDCLAASDLVDMFFVTCAQGYFMSGHEDNLLQELKMVSENSNGRKVYFIIEETVIPEERLAFLAKAAETVGVTGLVLSTAFAPYDTIRKPDANDIKKVRSIIGDSMEIIAAGNITAADVVEEYLAAGADGVLVSTIDSFEI